MPPSGSGLGVLKKRKQWLNGASTSILTYSSSSTRHGVDQYGAQARASPEASSCGPPYLIANRSKPLTDPRRPSSTIVRGRSRSPAVFHRPDLRGAAALR